MVLIAFLSHNGFDRVRGKLKADLLRKQSRWGHCLFTSSILVPFSKNPMTSRLYHLLGLLVCLTDTQQILLSDFILGMAFSSISASRRPTFMERLIQERQVNIAAFSVHLTRHQPRLSEVCIGCYDQSKYIGAIFWNPVVSQTYWSLSLNNIQVAGVNTSPRIVTAVCPRHHDI